MLRRARLGLRPWHLLAHFQHPHLCSSGRRMGSIGTPRRLVFPRPSKMVVGSCDSHLHRARDLDPTDAFHL